MKQDLKTEERTKYAEAVKLRERGKGDAAVKILRKLHLQSQQVTLKAGYCATIGSIHWERAKLRKAVLWFRKATQLAPRSETASLGLFHALWDADKQELALAEMKRYLRVGKSSEYQAILLDLKQAADPVCH